MTNSPRKAELALAAEDFPAARRALGNIAEKHPTVRSLAIMAAVERGEGADDSVVRGWLARAMNASRGPQWVCDNCHNIMTDWAPVCDSCAGFDTLTWREPPMPHRAATANGVEMLPLIVGRPAEASSDHYPDQTEAHRHLPHPAHATASPDPAPATAGRTAAPPAPPATEVANVRPGMVPRESDYAPSMTVTHPDPAARPAGSVPVESATVVTITPVPPGPAAAAANGAGNPPVRPDVEPIVPAEAAKNACPPLPARDPVLTRAGRRSSSAGRAHHS